MKKLLSLFFLCIFAASSLVYGSLLKEELLEKLRQTPPAPRPSETESLADDTQKDLSPDNISRFTEALRTQSITPSSNLMRRWQALKSDIFALGAKEARKITDQIKDPATKAAYTSVVNLMNQLASAIRALPTPQESIRKSFENAPQWMALKARKKALKAEELRALAQQTGNKIFSEKADFMEKHAAALKQGTKSDTSTQSKKINDLIMRG